MRAKLEKLLVALVVASSVLTSVNMLASREDRLLLWLDVNIPAGSFYLSDKYLSPFRDIGVRIAGVMFSADHQLWFLIEARKEHVSRLANVAMVRKVTLAKFGAWDWWDTNWRPKTRIEPLLYLAAQRICRDSTSEKVLAVINYERVDLMGVEQEKINEIKRGIIDDVSAHIRAVGGEVIRTSMAEYILAKLPATALFRLLENKHIRSLETDGPLYVD